MKILIRKNSTSKKSTRRLPEQVGEQRLDDFCQGSHLKGTTVCRTGRR